MGFAGAAIKGRSRECKQTREANHVIDRQSSDENPGFISLVTVLEIVWVLRSLFKRTPAQIAAQLRSFSQPIP